MDLKGSASGHRIRVNWIGACRTESVVVAAERDAEGTELEGGVEVSEEGKEI
jgi:hypothetical protein